ncbi:MAG: gamma-glutamylcyclotransferase [Pegethrix bostrychoides GSE-TBD4-15B]|jgi:gamma-glutamylcyclotransferase (GGCT)/AIG2-like uncharacterized protein YtfP|uniref:Gamma-glutamylcyclotransferase n=1 Tax=Pegethrix bostrychoides GSE-TBD4-15B TaxID=2839662 RepID=A0A951U532_9CYAN|nr:gamma-glutamylcyclotransferase [Pegethrix bostrychoides GSE-TBD4-15B]
MFGASSRASGQRSDLISGRPFSVFVYGTLKPGEENYERYCKKWVTQARAATVKGELFDLPFGYPALTPGNSLVHGYLLSFVDPAVLTMLDELEDYDPNRPLNQNEYLRVKTQAFSLNHRPLGQAWVYQMQPERVAQSRGIRLLEGSWSNQAPFQQVSL